MYKGGEKLAKIKNVHIENCLIPGGKLADCNDASGTMWYMHNYPSTTTPIPFTKTKLMHQNSSLCLKVPSSSIKPLEIVNCSDAGEWTYDPTPLCGWRGSQMIS